MKKYFLLAILNVLLITQAQAQFKNQGAFVNITSGSSIKALDGVVNTSGTFTVDGRLSTPADLTNSSGATLQGDGQYFIGGDWFNEASFNAGASTATFNGAQNSTVSSGGAAFNDLALNKAGGSNLLLADNMDVANTITFQASDNYIVLGNHNLQVVDISGYDATRHVRTTGTGFLVRTVNAEPVVFPVGNTAYNPATLSNVGASDLYFLRVADAVLSGGDTGSPLTTDAVGRGWFVEEATPGGSDLNISLQWNDSEEQAGFDRTNAYVSHFLAGSWDTQPTSAAVGTDPYTLSRSGVTVVSPFAVFAGDFLPVIDISGIILWEHDGVSGVKNTSVALSGDNTDTDLTPADGTYTLSASNGSSFTVTPTKNINKLNGITVADAMAIQQHVTQSNPITSPYKQVAADVNKSNSITTFDATVINQALLGNPAALAQIKTSWRFVPMDYSLPLPPWGFPEKINLTGVNGNVPGQDFFGIKTGDVVDTYADPANLTVPRPLVFQLNDQVLQAGAALNLGFRAGQFDDLAAWQFALRFDPAALQLTGIEPGTGSPALTTDHFGTYNISEGEIRSVWSQPAGVSVAETGAVFHMKFQVLESGRMLSEVLRLDESALPAYAYNSILEQTGVTLRYDQATHTTQVDAASLLGLQVQPNPFVNQTQVMFRLPEAADVQLRVLDAGGRELFRIAKTYSAGYQQETIRLAGVQGLLFCEITTPWGSSTFKMIGVEK